MKLRSSECWSVILVIITPYTVYRDLVLSEIENMKLADVAFLKYNTDIIYLFKIAE